jgi:hypothetical protein
MSNRSGFSGCVGVCHAEYTVCVEDDGRVGYAYLIDPEGRICGDVWLYNRCPAPLAPEWHDRDGAPYANPQAFVNAAKPFALPDGIDAFRLVEIGNGDKVAIGVLLGGELWAILMDGARPGFAALASANGPLAKVLETFTLEE